MTRLLITLALMLPIAPANAKATSSTCDALAARLLDLGHKIDPSEPTAANAPSGLVSAISRRLEQDEFVDCAAQAELSDELLMFEFLGQATPEFLEELGQ